MLRAVSLLITFLVPISSFASGHDVSTSTANQSAPVVTGNADGFAVAWLNQSGPFRTITAARVSSAGDPLDGSGIPLDEKATFSTAIAHSPSESLIVWCTSTSIVAARVTPSGVRLDTTPLLLSSQSNGQVAAVWDGSRYFVVWSTGNRLLGSFVGSDGAVTSPKVFLDETSLGNLFYTPDVSWDGRQFMVVFVEDGPYPGINCSSCAPPPDQVRIMRVSASGVAIDATRVEIPGVHYSVHIASSGTESLIALDAISIRRRCSSATTAGRCSSAPKFRFFVGFTVSRVM